MAAVARQQSSHWYAVGSFPPGDVHALSNVASMTEEHAAYICCHMSTRLKMSAEAKISVGPHVSVLAQILVCSEPWFS